MFVEEQAKDEKDERCVTPQSSDDETDDDEEDDEEEQKPSVVILARSHPGDANTSFVAQGDNEIIRIVLDDLHVNL